MMPLRCAASVNWSAAYSGVRSANVLGTGEILRLAALYRRKPVHFVSSVAACFSTDGPREVGETDDTLSHLDGIHLGYARSKCVAEALVRHASERGLPATLYRAAGRCSGSGGPGSGRPEAGGGGAAHPPAVVPSAARPACASQPVNWRRGKVVVMAGRGCRQVPAHSAA